MTRVGHTVVGVDILADKVQAINAGKSPIAEPELEPLLEDAQREGRLRATLDAVEAVAATDVSILCVGTPTGVNGEPDLGFVKSVTGEVAEALAHLGKRHAIIFRSTVLPGTTASLVAGPLRKVWESGQVNVFFYPEFMRTSSAIADFLSPGLSIVGTDPEKRSFPDDLGFLFPHPPEILDWTTAEMVKYACNAWHAAKVAFANEIGRWGKAMKVDSRRVMELLCGDTKLNISPYYLKPGNPFGGSCLPKDVRALVQQSREVGIHLPMLESLLASNRLHLEALLDQIANTGEREIAILGLAFKSGTDDLRESAFVDVAQNLLGHGYQVRIFDPSLRLARLIGSNKRQIDVRLPHLAHVLCDSAAQAIGSAGLIVAAQRVATIEELRPLITSRHRVLDVNGWPELRQLPCPYEGICW
jgi:GDP-mannose 6-dehydrogenase